MGIKKRWSGNKESGVPKSNTPLPEFIVVRKKQRKAQILSDLVILSGKGGPNDTLPLAPNRTTPRKNIDLSES